MSSLIKVLVFESAIYRCSTKLSNLALKNKLMYLLLGKSFVEGTILFFGCISGSYGLPDDYGK